MNGSHPFRQMIAVMLGILIGCCSCRASPDTTMSVVTAFPVTTLTPSAALPARDIPWPPVRTKLPDCTLHAFSEVRAPGTRTGAVVGLAFSPDGARLASVTGITTLTISPDVMLASDSDPSRVVVSDAATGRQLSTFADGSRLALKAAFSSDGRLLAFGAADGAVHLWDVAAGKLLRTLKGHQGPVYSTAFSPDGKTLVSGSADGTVVLWDVAAGHAQRTLEGHNSWVTSVAFSPDGETLAAGTSEQALVLWNAGTGERLRALEMPVKHVSHVAFSPDGRVLASSSPHGYIVLWDPSTGTLQIQLYTRISAGAIAFSPDGSRLAVARPGRVLVWGVRAEAQTHEFVGHDSSLYQSIAFAPDGRTVAAGAPDGSVTLWQMAPSTEFCHVRLVSSRLPSPSPVPPTRPAPLPTSTSIGGGAPAASELGTMIYGTHSDTHTIRLLSGDRAPIALTEGRYAYLSPDGCTLFVYRDRKRPPYGTEYLLMDVNTANPRSVHADHQPWNGNVYGAAWAPDSKSLTLTTGGSAKVSWSGSLWQVDASDGSITQITDQGAGRPLYSPDGRWIATSTPEIGWSHGSVGLWGAEGQGGRSLFTLIYPHSMMWAADSSGLVVALTWLEGEGSEQWWVPVAGEPVQLGHLPDAGYVSWQPGGERLAYYSPHVVEAQDGTARSMHSLHLTYYDGSEDVVVPGSEGMYPGAWSPSGRWLFTRDQDNVYIVDTDRLDMPLWLGLDQFHGWLDETHYLASAALPDGTELYVCEIPETCRLIAQMDDTIAWTSYANQRCAGERGEIPEVPYPPTTEADVISALIETVLHESDFGMRVGAAWKLGNMGPVEGAIPAFVQAMQEDPAMRWVSARSLGMYGSGALESVPVLIEALEAGCSDAYKQACHVERDALVEALQAITGQEYGPDAAAWRAWWDERQ